MSENKKSVVASLYDKYIVKAMGSMGLAFFASLIIGVIFGQFAKIPYLSFVNEFASVAKDDRVVGAVIGVSIAYGFKSKPLVVLSSAVVGAVGYTFEKGGPLGAFIAVIIGAEIASLVAGKTPFDIVLTPFVTIMAGGGLALVTSPYIGKFMTWLGNTVNSWTELNPLAAGILIALVVGVSLTSPLSSAGLCAAIGISGLASGAALVGCCAQMIAFAVASFKDNGIGGIVAQGLGSSKIQLPNVMKKPLIWITPALTSAIMGPISTCIFKLKVYIPDANVPHAAESAAAGMGTSALVGPLSAWTAEGYSMIGLLKVVLCCIIFPAAIAIVLHLACKKMGIVKPGDQKLPDTK